MCIFFVVAGVGHVIGIAELNQSRIFDAAVFFVGLGRRKDWLGAPRKVQAVIAFGVSEPRSPAFVLGAVEHDDFTCAHYDCRVERASRFPPALR